MATNPPRHSVHGQLDCTTSFLCFRIRAIFQITFRRSYAWVFCNNLHHIFSLRQVNSDAFCSVYIARLQTFDSRHAMCYCGALSTCTTAWVLLYRDWSMWSRYRSRSNVRPIKRLLLLALAWFCIHYRCVDSVSKVMSAMALLLWDRIDVISFEKALRFAVAKQKMFKKCSTTSILVWKGRKKVWHSERIV